jgi:diguanylate cyclase (GGDEF)-like protein
LTGLPKSVYKSLFRSDLFFLKYFSTVTYRCIHEIGVGVVQMGKDRACTTNECFHFEMVENYSALFKQIKAETLSTATIKTLKDHLEENKHIPDSEKKVHQNLLVQISNISEEIKTLHWMSKHLKVLHELGQTFSQTFEKEQIYKKAHELVSSVMNTDAFVIALYQEGATEYQLPFSIDNEVRYEPLTMPLGKGIISKVIETRETIHLKTGNDLEAHKNYVNWGNPDQNTETCIFVPMILNNQVTGVISAQNYREFAYEKEHEELLRIIGIQVSSAIETARLYDMVYEKSNKDELTSLYNSRKFHHDLEEQLSNVKNDDSVTLIMVDSDNLKKANDSFGHHVGDKLIKQIAMALSLYLEEGEEAYRYAGDEFMIISVNSKLDEVIDKAHRIQNYLKENPIKHEDGETVTSISMGIACYPFHSQNADTLKRMADEAMYESKKKGKNRITVYHSGMS